MKRLLLAFLAYGALTGCASDARYALTPGITGPEVVSRAGKPYATGRLADGDAYWDYTRQPFGYGIDRVSFDAGGRVHEVRNLLTEENFSGLQGGMTPDEVVARIGPCAPSEKRSYAGGTKSWSYRYLDGGIAKLLHIMFDAHDRLARHYTEWDPDVYSRGGGSKGHGR